MKRILFLLMLIPLLGMAQNNEKYLKGAVPEENGRVIFTKTIEVPLSAQDLHAIVKAWAEENYVPVEGMPNHKVYESEKGLLEVTAGGEEWLVFSSRALSLDRTRIYYKVNIACYDQKCVARIFNIRYWYDEEREGGLRYTAEEWITDEKGLNKKGTKLARMSGKFRRKTIDRVDELFTDLEMTINRKAIQGMMKK